MFARIIVQAVPGVGKVEFPADLPAGFLGPAIGRALAEAFELGLLGRTNFLLIRRVLLQSDSSASGSAVALIEEDVVPDGYYDWVPGIQVFCDWLQVVDEIELALEKVGLQFKSSTVKPIVACPLSARAIAPIRTSPPACPLATQPFTQEQPPPRRLKVYFTSALAEEYRGGDADFMKAIVDGMRRIGVEAVRLANSMLSDGPEQGLQKLSGQLLTLDYYGTLANEQRKIKKENLAAQSAATIKCMLKFMAEDKAKHPDIIQILNIQSRLPGSGNAFQTEAAIMSFRKVGVEVFVTVHEWRFNKLHMKERAQEVLPPTATICKAATGSIFVNDLDQQDSQIPGSTFIPIPITVAFEDIDVEAVLKRPVRVLIFGMLRPGKGFEKALDLGDLLLDSYLANFKKRAPSEQEWCVWVVGKLTSIFKEFEQLICKVYKFEADADWARTTLANEFGPANDRQRAQLTMDALAQLKEGWVGRAFDASSGDDDQANSAVSAVLAKCDELRELKYRNFFELQRQGDVPNRRLLKRQHLEVSEKLNGIVSLVTKELLKSASERDFVRDLCTQLKPHWQTLPHQQRLAFDVNSASALAKLGEAQTGRLASHPVEYNEAVSQSMLRTELKALKGQMEIFGNLPLPVFFRLNLSESQLIDAFHNCKYVYKPDDKGMADNASAMISPMANGCILFTKSGGITPQEFLRPPDQKPVAPDQKPVAPDQKPVAPDQKPVAPDQKPVAPDQKPVAPDQKPVAPDQKPVAPDQKPVAPDQKPVAPDQKPVAPDQKPVAPDQKPVAPDQKPVAPDQKPVAPDQKPVAPPVAPPDPERYKLDLGPGRYAESLILQDDPSFVVEEIVRREKDGNEANRRTLESLKHLTEHRYLPIMVAARHIVYYRRVLKLDRNKIVLVPHSS